MRSRPLPSAAAVVTPKRRRLTPPSPPLSTPPCSPNPNPSPNPKSAPFLKPNPRKSLTASLLAASGDVAGGQWEPLGVPLSELSLPLTLPTGQTFRWRRTHPSTFTGPVGPHLLSLSHLPPDGHVSFLLHGGPAAANPAAARAALRDYLNLGVSLSELWARFAESDTRFAELAKRFPGGARVLRQDPVECLFQFLCSSNNNIGRIEKMVGVLSEFGEYLGSVGGFDFYQFPTLERLAEVSELQLREAGFGYRAKYIVGAVKALQAKPGGGAEWLASLRGLGLNEVIEALCTLPGVGPKVAACVALFSLDQHHAIPVDTHVWQIATRYILPELSGMRLSQKLCSRVADAFVARFGKYAGWAQNVLFIAELPSQKALVAAAEETESTKRKHVKKKVAAQVFMDAEET